MATINEKGTLVSQLKLLANLTKAKVDEINSKIEDLVTTGGEPNVITAIKVNGVAQTITDKAVDIPIPGYTIERTVPVAGDYAAIYQLMKDGAAAGAAINIPKDMVVQSGSVVTLDAAGAAAAGLSNAGTYIKLVLANAANDILYIDVSGLIEYVTSGSVTGDMVFITIDETTHKVTAAITDGAITKAKLAGDLVTEIEGKVDKVEGKGLSANDYTNAEKQKLAGIAEGANNYAHPAHTAYASGLYKVTVDASGHVAAAAAVAKADITSLGIPAENTTYAPATADTDGLMSGADKTKLDGISFATDAEVEQELSAIFTA